MGMSGTLISVEEKALVAVSSLCCASWKAAWFKEATLLTSTTGDAKAMLAPRSRVKSLENILKIEFEKGMKI
jgi:hypothetical protein